MELDALTLTAPHTADTDLCIVGAGPAGLTLAHALGQGGRDVVLLESGGHGPSSAHVLNSGAIIDQTLADLRTSRARAIGGTATLWNTIRGAVAGSKYVPLDPIDLLARDELPDSGWPIAYGELEPWYRNAAASLGLKSFVPQDWVDARHPLLPFPEHGLTSSVYQWGLADHFIATLPDRLRASDNVRLLCNATAVSIGAENDAVHTLGWTALNGDRGIIRARQFVLACGTIENARLLLAWGVVPRRARTWLGRGLMEHPIDRSLIFRSAHPAVAGESGFYHPIGVGTRTGVVGRVGCSMHLLQRQRLWNASIRLFPSRRRRVLRPMRWAARILGRPSAAIVRTMLDLEQAPHRDNRVTLSDRCDPLGIPEPVVHWRWRAADEANHARMVRTIVDALQQVGALVQHTPGMAIDPDVHHHAGTTRMSGDPRDGVVDRDLKVHGIENLFVLGASVFPTAGVANPTLTVLALAHRLAAALGA